MLEFIPHTKRRKMTKSRRTGIFLARNGICGLCGEQIRAGEPYDIEHPLALNLGGSDDDADLWPVHAGKKNCHGKKTAHDRTLIAKRNSIIDQGYVGAAKVKRPVQGSRAHPSGLRKRMDGTVEKWS